MGIETTGHIIPGILGGFLPVFLWLWFWLYQDRKNPEPKGLLIITFILGMLIVFPAIYLETKVLEVVSNEFLYTIINSSIEEILKLGIPAAFLFRAKALNEPVDYAVYLVTAALGFAALENFLFILNISFTSSIVQVINASNLRFVGATVLHAVTAGAAGLAIGWNFYKEKYKRWEGAFYGLLIASVLHILFNLIIIKGAIAHIAIVHAVLWALVVVTVVLFKKMIRQHDLHK
jgi:RsiW-degrading membrane proteinase PrsW (M82 family)